MLVQARILLAKEQSKEALQIVIRVKEKALQERQISTIVEATVLEAICQMKVSHEEVALTTLHEALEQGAPYGYIRTFLDEVAIIPLLKKHIKIRKNRTSSHCYSVPLAYVEQLIEASPEDTQQDTVMDTLTPREQDVLRLLTSGVSNNDIANQLSLTTGTVRIYLSRIYSKLDVNSRMQAVLLVKDLEN